MADENKNMAMLKSEYAKKIGIPFRTLSRYINEMYIDEMKTFDYSVTQKYLTPKQIQFLNEKLVIT
ncbi:hypothetical protein ACRTDU_03935 [Sunxiuqinia elliptica]